MSSSRLVSGEGLECSNSSEETRRIHRENQEKIQAMSQSEIQEEQARLLSQLGRLLHPSLVCLDMIFNETSAQRPLFFHYVGPLVPNNYFCMPDPSLVEFVRSRRAASGPAPSSSHERPEGKSKEESVHLSSDSTSVAAPSPKPKDVEMEEEEEEEEELSPLSAMIGMMFFKKQTFLLPFTFSVVFGWRRSKRTQCTPKLYSYCTRLCKHCRALETMN